MLENVLRAAFRNLVRNWLYAAISVAGLAIGLVAVILTTLYVTDELSFDRFFPGHQRVYVIVSEVNTVGQPPISMDYAPQQIAAWLQQEVPGVKSTARLAYDVATVRRGDNKAQEAIAWVDPSFFEMMPLPVAHGSLAGALRNPDEVVLTSRMAQKYFGNAPAVGQSIEVAGHALRVRAVLANLPDETHLSQEIFAPGGAAFSPLARMNAPNTFHGFLNMVVNIPPQPGPRIQFIRGRVYVDIPDASAARQVEAALGAFSQRHTDELHLPPKATVGFHLVGLAKLHIYPFKGANLGATDVRGSAPALRALSGIAALVLVLAAINFINLATARASKRATEVGVRKAAGASRGHLIVQFVGEALLYVALAAFVALTLAELLLPSLNAALLRQMHMSVLASLPTASALILLLLCFGLLAGAYPAFVLSSFRPAAVLKGGPIETSGSTVVRQGLVVFQFAVLVILLLAVSVVWLQTRYAMNGGLRLDKENVLVIHTTPCRGAFADEVRRTRGVTAAACSSRAMLGLDDFSPFASDSDARVAGHPPAMLSLGLVDFGFFELYRVKPLAGRVFDRNRGADELAPMTPGKARTGSIVLNETAARRLGFATPAAAIQQVVSLSGGGAADNFQIIGVVPDFTLDLRNAAVKPTGYLVDFAGYPLDQVLSVKLAPGGVSEALGGVEQAWRKTGQVGAIRYQFLDDYVGRLYAGTIRQGMLVTALCAIALLLASLGLFGLAAFTAERRTKEIGVRKAMGATTPDILKLLLWQFARPVLLANVIGLPLAYLVLGQWLAGFSYRISMSPLLFVAAFGASLAIALATVLFHALAVARGKPIDALRYE